MAKEKPTPAEIPAEAEPTWAEIERVAKRVLTTPPAKKRREKAPKPSK